MPTSDVLHTFQPGRRDASDQSEHVPAQFKLAISRAETIQQRAQKTAATKHAQRSTKAPILGDGILKLPTPVCSSDASAEAGSKASLGIEKSVGCLAALVEQADAVRTNDKVGWSLTVAKPDDRAHAHLTTATAEDVLLRVKHEDHLGSHGRPSSDDGNLYQNIVDSRSPLTMIRLISRA
ncbi:hypothetical protein PaG_01275 [Moesziomyces aphidis]|uniref:Uncharacterized protein n=1 Tax=Moesziomyces aphidis TaxID=84754 RepID=W3VUF0_MOEAP|nr:hypothetical protein PaG_01275 [Moesziomyces aphidis]